MREESDEDNIIPNSAHRIHPASGARARGMWRVGLRASREGARVARLDQVILLLVRTGHWMGPSPE